MHVEAEEAMGQEEQQGGPACSSREERRRLTLQRQMQREGAEAREHLAELCGVPVGDDGVLSSSLHMDSNLGHTHALKQAVVKFNVGRAAVQKKASMLGGSAHSSSHDTLLHLDKLRERRARRGANMPAVSGQLL